MASIYAFEWDYDGVGNRLYQKRDGAETYYTYNAANELTHFVEAGGGTYFEYDARGNCTAIDEPTGATYFEYSDADLVTSISYPSGVANYFYYDGKLRRYAMEDSDGLAYFTWDQNGMNLLTEFDAYGNTIAEYTHGYTPIDGIGSMVAAKRTDYTDPMFPVTYYQYPVYDGIHGDVHRMVDENGNVTAYYEYDPWGNRLQVSESGASNRLGYQSNWITLRDSDGEICLSPTRLYHAPTGRFLQRDPARLRDARWPGRPQCGPPPRHGRAIGPMADGHSLYALAGNSPGNSVDPSGLLNIIPMLPVVGTLFNAFGHAPGEELADYFRCGTPTLQQCCGPARGKLAAVRGCEDCVNTVAGTYIVDYLIRCGVPVSVQTATGMLLPLGWTGTVAGLLVLSKVKVQWLGVILIFDSLIQLNVIARKYNKIGAASGRFKSQECKCPW